MLKHHTRTAEGEFVHPESSLTIATARSYMNLLEFPSTLQRQDLPKWRRLVTEAEPYMRFYLFCRRRLNQNLVSDTTSLAQKVALAHSAARRQA